MRAPNNSVEPIRLAAQSGHLPRPRGWRRVKVASPATEGGSPTGVHPSWTLRGANLEAAGPLCGCPGSTSHSIHLPRVENRTNLENTAIQAH